jgi:hypothetical protein
MDVIVTEAGFRAVGGQIVPGEPGVSNAVWYSPDGITWVYQQDESWVQVVSPGGRPVELQRSTAADLGSGTMGVLIDTGAGLAALGAGPDGGLAWLSPAP